MMFAVVAVVLACLIGSAHGVWDLFHGEVSLQQNERCPDGFTFHKERCYVFKSPWKDDAFAAKAVDFETAQTYCKGLSTGDFEVDIAAPFNAAPGVPIDPSRFTRMIADNALYSRDMGYKQDYGAFGSYYSSEDKSEHQNKYESKWEAASLTWILYDKTQNAFNLGGGEPNNESYAQDPESGDMVKVSGNHSCWVASYFDSQGKRQNDKNNAFDYQCNQKVGNFVCEVAATPLWEPRWGSGVSEKCPQDDPRFGTWAVYDAKLDMCYYVASVAWETNFDSAENFCKTAGMDLATPKTLEENKVIQEILAYEGLSNRAIQGYIGLVNNQGATGVYSTDAAGLRWKTADKANDGSLPQATLPDSLWAPQQPSFPFGSSVPMFGVYGTGGKIRMVQESTSTLGISFAPYVCQKKGTYEEHTMDVCAPFVDPNANSSFARCGCNSVYNPITGECEASSLQDGGSSPLTITQRAIRCVITIPNDSSNVDVTAVNAFIQVAKCLDPLEASSRYDITQIFSDTGAFFSAVATVEGYGNGRFGFISQGRYPEHLPLMTRIKQYIDGVIDVFGSSVPTFCYQLCPCGHSRTGGYTSSACSATFDMSLEEIIINARIEALCEIGTRYDDLMATFPAGTWVMHAATCASSAMDDPNSEAGKGVFNALDFFLAIAAEKRSWLIEANAGTDNIVDFSLLDSAVALIRGDLISSQTGKGIVPWFSAEFWAENSGTGLSAVINNIEAFTDNLEQLNQRQELLNLQNTILDAIDYQSGKLFDGMKQAALDTLGVLATEEEKSSVDAIEAIEMAQRAADFLKMTQDSLMGNDAENTGSLGLVGELVEDLIQKRKALAEKELELNRRRAIWSLVGACISLALNCVTLGASAAAQAGKLAAKSAALSGSNFLSRAALSGGAKVTSAMSSHAKVLDKLAKAGSAAKKAKHGMKVSTAGKFGVYGMTDSSLNPVKAELKEDLGNIGATAVTLIPIYGEIKEIENSIAVFQEYDDRLQDIQDQAAADSAEKKDSVDELRRLLNVLAAKAAAISMELFASSILAHAPQIDIMDTTVDSELLDAPYIWESARNSIVRLLTIDFGLCPGEKETNPFLTRRRLVMQEDNMSTMTSEDKIRLRAAATTPDPRSLIAASEGPGFRRSLASKGAEKENAAAAQSWENLNFGCGVFQNDLEQFVRWGAEAHGLTLRAVDAIRSRAVILEHNAAMRATAERWNDALIEIKQRAAARNDLSEGNEQAKTYTRAISYSQAQAMVLAAKTAISELCASYFYSNPSRAVAQQIATGISVDDQCQVVFSQGVPLGPVERVKALKNLLVSGSGVIKTWRTAILSDESAFLSAQLVPASCDITQASFFERLLSPDSGGAWIDVVPTSFDSDKFSNCLTNAEVKEFSVVFRGAQGQLLPSEDSPSVEVQIVSTRGAQYYKYAEENNVLQEYGFAAPQERKFKYTYHAVSKDRGCALPTVKDAVGDGDEYICVLADDQDQDAIFSRLPPYGRWKIQLGPRGWPAGQALPTFAEVKIVTAAETCSQLFDLTTDILPATSVGEASNNDRARTGNLGSVCNGKEFPSGAAAILTTSEEDDSLLDEILASSWAIPGATGVGIGIFISCSVAFLIHRIKKKMHEKSSASVSLTTSTKTDE